MARRPARPAVPPETLARELERLLSDVAGTVDDVADRPHPLPESLHQLHREMRRLRHALGIWQRLLSARDRALVRPLDARLKRLARLVGRVRDRDVMLDLIEGGSLPKPSGRDAWAVARLRSRLRDDARTGRELLRVYLRSERDAHLFEGLRESVDFTPRRGAAPQLAEVLREEQSERRADVRSAQRRARKRPSSNRLHQLRIEVRRLRHLSEVRRRLQPTNRIAFPSTVRRLQSRLGRLHDLDLVIAGLDPELRATAWGQMLKKERRKARGSVRRALKATRWPKPPETAPSTAAGLAPS
ncbi:MAG TPA: CHAD domain-containing protein [Thermoplasmata archaeon]|nr:CHAD domain-containing protein [Thermoplasmata archaeon]